MLKGSLRRRRKRKRINSDLDGLTAQRVNWLLADGKGSAVKGAPLRCLLCHNSLLLSAGTIRPPTSMRAVCAHRLHVQVTSAVADH